MSGAANARPMGGGRLTGFVIYALLLVFALVFLMPLFVMVITSFKNLDEIRDGNLLSLPHAPTIAPWLSAWGSACIGLTCAGIKGYFGNSIAIVVPAVVVSTLLGAMNGYVLTKWRFPGHKIIFALMLFACFIPFQAVLIPAARVLGILGLGNSIFGLILVHVVYGLGFTTLFFRNYYEAFPTELMQARRMIDGAGFFQIFRRILLPNSATDLHRHRHLSSSPTSGTTFCSARPSPAATAIRAR